MKNLAASREVSAPSSTSADLQSALRRKRRGIEPGEIKMIPKSGVARYIRMRNIQRNGANAVQKALFFSVINSADFPASVPSVTLTLS